VIAEVLEGLFRFVLVVECEADAGEAGVLEVIYLRLEELHLQV